MHAPIDTIKALALASVGILGCMPTDVDFMPPTDIDEDCDMLNANIIVRSANDARSLPQKCFMVAGDVEVIGSDLGDLGPLIYLRQANTLRIKDNPVLHTLAGLDRVKVIEHVEIDNNPMLTDVSGLGRTDTVTRVTISKNPQLASLEGLRSLREVGAGGVSLRDNGGPRNLQELEALERIEGSLRIEGNGGMTDLRTARALDSVGEVVIIGNRTLNSVGLEVTTVNGDLTISDNESLATFAGFSRTTGITGDLTVERNAALTDLRGFSASFNTIGKNLKIDGNAVLADVYDMAVNLISVGGSLIVTNNILLSACRAEDFDFYLEDIGGLIDIGDNSAAWDPCH